MGLKSHTRRKRRQAAMVIRSGGKFRINHRSKGGRTGGVHARKPKPKS